MVAAFGLGARLGGARPRDRLLAQAGPGGRAAVGEAGLHAQADRPARVALEAARAAIEETAERIDAGEGAAVRSTSRARSPSTWRPRPATPPPTRRSRPTAATATRTTTWSRRSSATSGSPRIYEGTSEIMEMTIARDRWQQHLKTSGAYYRDAARSSRRCRRPPRWAPRAALALECLAEVLEACRVGRLTRNQHVLLRLGELSPTPSAQARWPAVPRAAAAGALPDKADTRFDAGRARRGQPGLRPGGGAQGRRGGLAVGGRRRARAQTWPPPCRWSGCGRAQAGLLADMNLVANALYRREAESS